MFTATSEEAGRFDPEVSDLFFVAVDLRNTVLELKRNGIR